MGKIPGFTFYPGDWLRDHISGCSLAAQGLWLRMMILAHDSDRYGYLTIANGTPMPPETISRRVGVPLDQYVTLLAELDAAGVPSRTPEGIIYSRRMARDQKYRQQSKLRMRKMRKRDASVTHSVTPMLEIENEIEKTLDFDVGSKSKSKPSLEEVTLYCLERHNSVNPQQFMDFYLARNWKLNRGVPMTDWRAAVRYWESNTRGGSNGPVRESAAEARRRKNAQVFEQFRNEGA